MADAPYIDSNGHVIDTHSKSKFKVLSHIRAAEAEQLLRMRRDSELVSGEYNTRL